MEANGLRVRKTADERPQPGERPSGGILVVEPDCGRDLGVGVTRGEPRGRRELPLGRDGAAALLETDAPDEQPLSRRRHPPETRLKLRQPTGRVRVEQIAGVNGRRRVRLEALRLPPRVEGRSVVPPPEEREPE